ncbi:hypothetical protein [Mesorhizobium sp. M0296]|uniref:hypothetical protein n=1 Tax=Mesorhizobium sp. M0296 TaxID=2956931 RepID=UPI003336F4C8
MPTLASREGQACGALDDVLLNGLSQDRLRRLFSHAAGRSRGLQNLPLNWSLGLQPGAALFELDQWLSALDAPSRLRTDGIDPRPILIPVLDMLANGLAMAERACSEAERRHEATSADLAAACEAINAEFGPDAMWPCAGPCLRPEA